MFWSNCGNLFLRERLLFVAEREDEYFFFAALPHVCSSSGSNALDNCTKLMHQGSPKHHNALYPTADAKRNTQYTLMAVLFRRIWLQIYTTVELPVITGKFMGRDYSSGHILWG
jgi:hypothetical protein